MVEKDEGVRAYFVDPVKYGYDVISGTLHLGLLYAEEETESGWVRIKAYDSEHDCSYAEAEIYVGCQACEQANSSYCEYIPGGLFVSLSSVDIRLGLGKTSEGRSAGELLLRADAMSPDLATPAALEFNTLAANVQGVYDAAGLRQVIAPETFVDIAALDGYSYEVRFYLPEAQGAQANDGLYAVSGDPIAVLRIENPDASDEIYNRLRVTEIRDGQSYISDYEWDEDAGAWSLSKGGGLRVEEKSCEYPSDGLRTETHVISNSGGAIASKTETTFQTFDWGESIVQEVVDPDGEALTTVTDYYIEPDDEGSYGKVKSRQNPDGSWVVYVYDSKGRVIEERRPWLDSDFDTTGRTIYYDYTPVDEDDAREFRDVTSPRTITEEINGIVTSKTFYAYLAACSGNRIVITERAASQSAEYGDPGNIRTTSEYYEKNPGALTSDKIKTSQSSDGLMTTYEYVYGDYVEGLNPGDGVFTEGSGDYRPHHGHPGHDGSSRGDRQQNHPEPVHCKFRGRYALQRNPGPLTDRPTRPSSGPSTPTTNWAGPSRTDNSDGTYTETHWSCCAVESQTGADGVSTWYTLDDLKRPYMVTREGLNGDVTTTKTMDALGRTLSTTTEAGSLSQASSTIYDTAGRIASSTNQAGLTTTYVYENAGRTQTVTQPGGATRTTTRHLDGRSVSATGTAVTPQYYEYGVEDDGTQWTKVYTGSTGSAMWSKSYTDFLGRTIKTEQPAFGGGTLVAENFYDEHGRLIRSSAPGRADSLYVYDELGNQKWSGLDVDGDGELTAASMDRLTESSSEYALISGDWWRESKQIIYAEANSAEQTETGASRSRLTGLGSGLVGESVSIDMHGNETASITTLDRDAHTQTREVDYPDSDVNAIAVSEYGLTTSSTDKTGLTYTFEYDAFGRRFLSRDPRIGESRTFYDDKGRVESIQDAAGNTSRFYYDAETGRKIADENALGPFRPVRIQHQGATGPSVGRRNLSRGIWVRRIRPRDKHENLPVRRGF